MPIFVSLPSHASDWLLPRRGVGELIEATAFLFTEIVVLCTPEKASIRVVLSDPVDEGEFQIEFEQISQFKLHDDGIRMQEWLADGGLNTADVTNTYYELDVGPYYLELGAGRVQVKWRSIE